jgi:hypothetical protein
MSAVIIVVIVVAVIVVAVVVFGAMAVFRRRHWTRIHEQFVDARSL